MEKRWLTLGQCYVILYYSAEDNAASKGVETIAFLFTFSLLFVVLSVFPPFSAFWRTRGLAL